MPGRERPEGFGTWVWDVSRHPADVIDNLAKRG
jgi:hypothetical protein